MLNIHFSKYNIIITFAGFPSQNVTVTEEGLSIAGYLDYALLCTVTREQHLSSSSIISIQWLGPNGLISTGENFTVNNSEGSGSGYDTLDVLRDAFTTTYYVEQSANMVTSRLQFKHLLTSQAGEYTCRTFLSIPSTQILNYSVVEMFTVTVRRK